MQSHTTGWVSSPASQWMWDACLHKAVRRENTLSIRPKLSLKSNQLQNDFVWGSSAPVVGALSDSITVSYGCHTSGENIFPSLHRDAGSSLAFLHLQKGHLWPVNVRLHLPRSLASSFSKFLLIANLEKY